MAVVKNLMVRAGMDASGVVKGTRKAKGTLNSFHKSVSRTMKMIGVTLAGIGISRIVRVTTEAYEMQREQEVKLTTVMRQRMGATKDMIRSIQQLTVEQQKLGVIGDEVQLAGAQQLSTFINTSESLKTLIPQMNNLAAQQKGVRATGSDMVNIANMFGKVMDGQVGALRRVGISFTEAEEQMLKYGNEQQRAATLAQVVQNNVGNMNQSLAATPQGRWQQITNAFSDLQEEIGRAFVSLRDLFVPVLSRTINWLNALAVRLNQVTTFVTTFTNALFGRTSTVAKQTNAITGQIGAVEGIGEAYEESAKKARRATAGFDEVNQMAEPVSAGGVASPEFGMGGIGGALDALEDVDFEGVTDKMRGVSKRAKEMGEAVRSSFKGIRESIENNKPIIKAGLSGVLGALTSLALFKGFGALKASIKALIGIKGLGGIVSLLKFTPKGGLVLAIGAITGALVSAFRGNEDFQKSAKSLWGFIKDSLSPVFLSLGNVMNGVWVDVLKPFGEFLSRRFKLAWDNLGKVVNWLWEEVFSPFSEFLLWMRQEILRPISRVIGEILAGAFRFLGKVIMEIWDNVLRPLTSFLGTVLGGTIKALATIFLELWKYVLKPIGDFLVSVFKENIEAVSDAFIFLWDKVLKPLAYYLSKAFFEDFKTVTEGIRTIIEGLETTFNGLINFITGIFTGNWQKAWEGVRDIFKGIFDTLYGIVKVPLNLIINSINRVIDGLNKIRFDIPDWVPGFGGKGFGINIPNIPRLARGGITDVNNPFMAVVGDNKTQREVVSPLGDLMDMISSAVGTSVMNAMQFNQSSQTDKAEVILNLDGTEFARTVVPFLNRENSRIGKKAIITT